jgi:translation initiation factor IF-3
MIFSLGAYSPHERLRRILFYKLKKLRKRSVKPVSRRFMGRSTVAKTKLRFRGRFVKKDSMIKKSLFKVHHMIKPQLSSSRYKRRSSVQKL